MMVVVVSQVQVHAEVALSGGRHRPRAAAHTRPAVPVPAQRGRGQHDKLTVMTQIVLRVHDVLELLGGLTQLHLVELAADPLAPCGNTWGENGNKKILKKAEP